MSIKKTKKQQNRKYYVSLADLFLSGSYFTWCAFYFKLHRKASKVHYIEISNSDFVSVNAYGLTKNKRNQSRYISPEWFERNKLRIEEALLLSTDLVSSVRHYRPEEDISYNALYAISLRHTQGLQDMYLGREKVIRYMISYR